MNTDPQRMHELLDALLDESESQASEHAAERAELEAFLRSSRAALTPDTSEWSGVREGALVGRVLARTTREDLSWRGEYRLVAGFVRERLAGSPFLRIVAASLVLHLVAVPTLAWYLYQQRQPDTGARLGFAPREGELDLFDDELEAELEAEPPARDEDPFALDEEGDLRDRIANALRRSRFVLSRVAHEAPRFDETLAPATALETKLIVARTRFLARRAWTEWLDDDEQWNGAGPGARVLWAEVLLDRLVLEGHRSPSLSALLSRLENEEEPRTAAMTAFVERILRRARSYGVWPAPSGFDPRAAELPLGRDWFRSLREGFEGTAFEADPALAAFERWIRR